MTLNALILSALLAVQATQPYPTAPRSPADQIAPHGDPRDQGWRPEGEEAPRTLSRLCGGVAGFRCPEPLVCDTGPGPAHPDKTGVCRRVRRPQFCTREYRPVCGENGRTYPNACEAARAGMEVRRTGACSRR